MSHPHNFLHYTPKRNDTYKNPIQNVGKSDKTYYNVDGSFREIKKEKEIRWETVQNKEEWEDELKVVCSLSIELEE